ncbi:MAG: hypothetical protein V7K21_18830, partial [Nostoc sp.]|uniref:hypothetical protein n=1 Tax=Nostoc sp. TaxID=1180 RepID=UPI002FFB0980
MQIIQSPLGNNVHSLGVRSSLSYPHKMLLKKESNSLNSQSNIIGSIQNKPPLVTSSKFFLSRKHELTIQPLIDWDNEETQGINSEFPLVEFDSSDSISLLKNSNESVKDSIPEKMPTRIEKNTSNDTSQKLNNKGKSKSTKTNKSQQPPEKKSIPKSKTKKAVKSSAAKNVAQFDESNIPINRNQDSLLVSDEPLPVEANSDIPKLQRNVASNNTTSENNSVSSITPSIMSSTSHSVEDKSTLFRNITNDDLQLNSELPSSLLSPELEAIAPKMSATSPEIGETVIAPKMSAISPETGETVIAPKMSAISPE